MQIAVTTSGGIRLAGRTAAVFCLGWLLLFGSDVHTRGSNDRDLDLWIGQMLLVGFRGTELGPQDVFLQQVRDLQLGGTILFDYDVPTQSSVRNIVSAEQVRRLTSQLQSSAPIPLFIAVDQEGGKVARFKEKRNFPPSLSQQEIGALDDEEESRAAARSTAQLLAGLGVNVNFAPVLDLALNPDNPIIARIERSYGADPDLVIRQARWAIQEFHAAGILSAVKHFPGHGSSETDSHLGLPDVTSVWSPLELKPFGVLVREGLPDMVMTAHLFQRNWDSKYPATLSSRVIQDILRDTLGFQGVVVSDDMQMSAIARNFSFEEAIEKAILAGVDILTFGNNQSFDPLAAPRAVEVIRGLVRDGRVSRERIQQSYRRILELKGRLKKAPPEKEGR